jgi:DNA primase
VAREVLDRETDVRFDARGLVQHEGRLQADIRIVTLPDGFDPDKLIREDPSRWPVLLEQAKPIVAYVIDIATDGLDMQDGKAKAAVVQQVLPVIDDVVNPVEREHYRQLLARRLQVDERILHVVSVPTSRKRAKAVAKAKKEKRPARDSLELAGLAVAIRGSTAASEMKREYFLRQCLAFPQLISQIDKKLAVHQQPLVTEADFTRLDDKALWREIRQHPNQRPVATIDDLWDSLDEDEYLRERIEILLSIKLTSESELERLPDRLVLSVLDWRLERTKSLLAEVERLFRDSQEEQNLEMLELYGQQLRELPSQVRSIDRARGAMSAAGRRQSTEHRSIKRNTVRAD